MIAEPYPFSSLSRKNAAGFSLRISADIAVPISAVASEKPAAIKTQATGQGSCEISKTFTVIMIEAICANNKPREALI